MNRLLPALLACTLLGNSAQGQPDNAGDARAMLAALVDQAKREHAYGRDRGMCLNLAISGGALDDVRAEDLGGPAYEWWTPPTRPGGAGPSPLDADTARAINAAAGALIRRQTPAPTGDPGRPEAAGLGLPLCSSDEQVPRLNLSAPSISGDFAFIDSGLECGPLCGSGSLYALRRRAGGWQVVGRVSTWIR